MNRVTGIDQQIIADHVQNIDARIDPKGRLCVSDSAEYGTVLRAKGMVEGEDGRWIYFDMVPEEADVRSGEPEFTGRICVIGAKLNGQKLEQLFGLDED